ncbi:hypothetical protein LTR05_008739 [Lithohypha guttulata]|uniref:Major facilitator superfamily (MFS) profile domain-containing protein n=1 Tax=Lithohypha guttulata TaxID=1690604 RepID=A0AAN7ST65_9EURO|nr:hypothetical protein LTR05_008739 [Lithohypha guttulata]
MVCLPKDKLSHKVRSISELDLAGTLTGVAGLIGFNFAWNEGPVAGWQAPYTIVMLIIGVALLLAFVYLELSVVTDPLLPRMAFTLDTSLVLGCIAAGWSSFGIWVFYYWQFLEVIRGDSILQSAAEMCPAAVSGAIAAVATGMLMRKMTTGTILVCSMVAFCMGIVLVVSNPPGRTYWAQLFLSPIITSWGMDMSFPAGVIVLSYHMPHHQQGLAASLVNTVVNYSISVGLGFAGTAERYVVLNGADQLEGYRAALYVGISLDVLGLILAAGLVIHQRLQLKQNSAQTIDG